MTPQHPVRHRVLSTLLHGVGLAAFAWGWAFRANIRNPLLDGYGGSLQFITFNAFAISTATFGIALLADVFSTRRLSPVKNALASVAAPLNFLVSVMYWGMRAVDKNLLVKEGYSLPVVPDLCYHAMPAVVLTLDVVFLSPPSTVTVAQMLRTAGGLAVVYWVWIEHTYTMNNL
jgi:hypothetical protein